MTPELCKRLFEHAKEAHFFQLEERNRVAAQVGFCFAGLGLIAGLYTAYLNAAPAGISFVSGIYWTLIVLASVFGVIALGYFFRALGFWQPTQYCVLQSPATIVNEIREVDALVSGSPQEQIVEAEFARKLTDLFAQAAAANEFENERRKDLLRHVVLYSILTLISLLLNAAPFFYLKFRTQHIPQTAEISKPAEINHEQTTP